MPIAIAMIGGSPSRVHHRHQRTAHRMVATLNIAGDSDGMKKRRSEFSIPIIATATATVVRNGSHDAGQLRRQLQLAGHRRELRGDERRNRPGEDDAENGQCRR